MLTVKSYRRCVGLSIALLFACGAPEVLAQSTIFNVPSGETVEKGKGFFEFDYLPQVPAEEHHDRVHIFVPRILVGLTENLEIGANFVFEHEGHETQTFFRPELKWKFYGNHESGIEGAVGAVGFVPLNHRKHVDGFTWLYGVMSVKAKGDFGPRLTAGPYGIVGGDDHGTFCADCTRAGAHLAYEQPLHARVSFIADWSSGENFIGYFTPGISLKLPGHSLLNIGYSIGNDTFEDNDSHNRFLFFYYGITF